MNPLPDIVSLKSKDEYLVSIGEAPPEVLGPAVSDSAAALLNPEPWDLPAYAAAFEGLAGEFVRLLFPHTESAAFALLGQFLTAFGSVIGRSAYQIAEADKHYSNLYVCIVGDTSRARKGSSWSQVRHVMEIFDPEWARDCINSGLATGEGLIHHVRDPQDRTEPSEASKRRKHPEPDAGATDKRCLILATELASVLAVMSRSGNTLSATLRDAWDRGELRTMSKGSPERATGAHVSIIAHITNEELRRQLTSTESGNGFANRFLWVAVHRSKLLPEGGSLAEAEIERLAHSVSERVVRARAVTLMRRDDEARALWRSEYARLSDGHPGLFGAVTSRAEAQVLRLSQLYALLDLSDIVRAQHLASALAFWHYAEDSARFIFGDASGDPVADRILAAVRQTPGMPLTDVSALFGRHETSGRIQASIDALVRSGAIIVRRESTGGRPATRVYPGTRWGSATMQ